MLPASRPLSVSGFVRQKIRDLVHCVCNLKKALGFMADRQFTAAEHWTAHVLRMLSSLLSLSHCRWLQTWFGSIRLFAVSLLVCCLFFHWSQAYAPPCPTSLACVCVVLSPWRLLFFLFDPILIVFAAVCLMCCSSQFVAGRKGQMVLAGTFVNVV